MRATAVRLVRKLTLLALLASPSWVVAGSDQSVQLDLTAQTRGSPQDSGSEYGVAVFSFDDPEDTGLGDAVARILSRRLLIDGGASYIVAIKHPQGLAPEHPGAISYYNKAAKMMEDKDLELGVWGRVLPKGNGLLVDTHVQISPQMVERGFTEKMRLPFAMGWGTLRVRLRPDRFKLQRLVINGPTDLDDVRKAADRLLELREEPRRSAPIRARLPKDADIVVTERKNTWVRITGATSELEGWISAEDLCLPVCRLLFEPADFVGGLLAYARKGAIRKTTDHLSTEALAVEEFLMGLAALDGSPRTIPETAVAIAMARRWWGPNRWTGFDARTGIDRRSGPPPGRAAFANLEAVAEIVAALKTLPPGGTSTQIPRNDASSSAHRLASMAEPMDQGDPWIETVHIPDTSVAGNGDFLVPRELSAPGMDNSPIGIARQWRTGYPSGQTPAMRRSGQPKETVLQDWDRRTLPHDFVSEIAERLAHASLDNPTDGEVLHNLAVLFSYLGDARRSRLAADLAERMKD